MQNQQDKGGAPVMLVVNSSLTIVFHSFPQAIYHR